MEKKICIIIPNLNGESVLKDCLNSIKYNTDYKNYKIIVADDGSSDNSEKMVKSKFRKTDFIKNKRNKGFSGCVNEGIKYASEKYNPEYFYLLNNDTLVGENWLSESVKTAEKSSETGIVGSKQLTFERVPSISAGWIKFLGVTYYFGNEEKEVNWVSGAGMLIKKKVIEKTGLFDEIYSPAYYEETDFEIRAKRKGFKIIYCPKSIFLHKGGNTISKSRTYYDKVFYRNRFIYFYKNHNIFWVVSRFLRDIIKGIKNQEKNQIYSGYREGLKRFAELK